MKQKRKKKGFNDLLIPIILVLAVLPFVTRMILYKTGLSAYSWYSDYDISTDFFSYYKSYLFIIISAVSAIILFVYFIVTRTPHTHRKAMSPFVFIGIYGFFTLLSTILSIDRKLSLVGGMGHFESVLVLLGYLIMLLYTYQIDIKEEDYRTIYKALLVSMVVMCIIGVFQVFGMDFITSSWGQKLIIPSQYWSYYLGKVKTHLTTNSVSLTLFNPNFASVYLSMIIPLLIVQLLPSSGYEKGPITINNPGTHKKGRILNTILILVLLFLLIMTNSRTGLVSIAGALILLGYIYRKLLRKHLTSCFAFVCIGIVLLIGLDSINNFRFVEKIGGTVQSFFDQEDSKLQEILTNQDEVVIHYGGDVIRLTLTGFEKENVALVFYNKEGDDISSSYDLESETLQLDPFETIKFRVENKNNEQYIVCDIEENTWQFSYDKQNGYSYLNAFGKLDQLKKVDKIGLKGLEDIGSGRGFIWSRTIPLLRETIFLGKGPDTFPLEFPQSDYIGKANNCKTPYTFIEKPHNMYLMIGIQTGLISLIALVCFYIIYLIKSVSIYKNSSLTKFHEKLGVGCLVATVSFVISGFFNDSSLQTTPVFVILLGLGMNINSRIKKELSKI